MDEFIAEHIVDINNRISDFNDTEPRKVDILIYLERKFINDLPDIKDRLVELFEGHGFVRARIKQIANELHYYHKHLEKFYDIHIYQSYISRIDRRELLDEILNNVENQIANHHAYRFIRGHIEKIGVKLLFLLQSGGFKTNLLGVNQGLMVANSGDSAQFLFLSRAILSGFNCSNVDVRSSRYDAIIDFEGHLLKVQVKGVSDNKISFKDRDRGGQGIDHTHERNRGRYITSEDCDIYVAVDKQCGLCYIIPMDYVDGLPDDEKVNVNINDLNQFLEQWEVVERVARNNRQTP